MIAADVFVTLSEKKGVSLALLIKQYARVFCPTSAPPSQ